MYCKVWLCEQSDFINVFKSCHKSLKTEFLSYTWTLYVHHVIVYCYRVTGSYFLQNCGWCQSFSLNTNMQYLLYFYDTVIPWQSTWNSEGTEITLCSAHWCHRQVHKLRKKCTKPFQWRGKGNRSLSFIRIIKC